VDGTLIEAWASQKSFRKKEAPGGDSPSDNPGNPAVDFHGEKRSNATHQSTTDPEAKLFRKGKGREAKLSYMGHVLMENRNGPVVDAELTQSTGKAERESALRLLEQIPGSGRVTVGADKGYDTRDFIAQARALEVTPHVAQNIKPYLEVIFLNY
jgi:hypothetical protein